MQSKLANLPLSSAFVSGITDLVIVMPIFLMIGWDTCCMPYISIITQTAIRACCLQLFTEPAHICECGGFEDMETLFEKWQKELISVALSENVK